MQTILNTSDLSVESSGEFIINHAGAGGLLFDASIGKYQGDIQNRIWLLALTLNKKKTELHIDEVITGVNNILISFDPFKLSPIKAEELLIYHWKETKGETLEGRYFSLPVIYGGAAKADLIDMSIESGLTIDQIIEMHSAGTYTVACLGSMPGFAYLTGLDPRLARPRLSSPRMGIPKGSVIIGGQQTGIMPCTAPSGWHLLGSTTAELFNPSIDPPCLLNPGDIVRFEIEGIEL